VSPPAEDAWDPAQYDRFQTERRQPFFDLLALVQPAPGGRIVDLGCGTGELTRELHRQTGASETVGIDTSDAMLSQAADFAGDGLRFERGDLGDYRAEDLDVVFANASLQWVPDHPALIGRLTTMLTASGQLAFQVPANYDHPSHRLATDIAHEEPFFTAMGGDPPEDHTRSVLAPEAYAGLLDRLGFARQHVRLQVYGHQLEGTDDVVEWVKGTLLTPYRRRLDTERYERFVQVLRDRLRAEVGDQRPYFYPFKRILCWAQR
jgi:trans-aconitate 2-methyltransferase